MCIPEVSRTDEPKTDIACCNSSVKASVLISGEVARIAMARRFVMAPPLPAALSCDCCGTPPSLMPSVYDPATKGPNEEV